MIRIKVVFHTGFDQSLENKNDLFNIKAQTIDCGYTLEPPLQVPTIYVIDS